MKILLVEDDLDMVLSLEKLFGIKGWSTKVARNLYQAKEILSSFEIFDVCVLDLQLGRDRGEELLPILREKGVPTLILTVEDDVRTKVECLEKGAEDYLVKPFEPEELIARIGVLVRRLKRSSPSLTLSFGDLKVDMKSMELTVKGQKVRLPRKQLLILIKLMENAEKPVTYQSLMSYAWDITEAPDMFSLRTHVHNIRKILKEVGLDIVSYRGIGYMLVKDDRHKK
ncbi:two component transcriptional regulator, winged helix family [Thermocrinis albus DSM 14484]|uniref:Two component transcriptional regulator, winged helix family n=1 Tax=Thermocrinis albus (strain DSM 14484 / JCM 11386 / HI 11/12) TaxID=638303 RepID=D3SME8_THEAH|nr:response regulator transcription factor [Thermocrinis albus]ADC89928.1 two component transcriptional regulator, winged helix family [Thermocrinis albus DSM 14484]